VPGDRHIAIGVAGNRPSRIFDWARVEGMGLTLGIHVPPRFSSAVPTSETKGYVRWCVGSSALPDHTRRKQSTAGLSVFTTYPLDGGSNAALPPRYQVLTSFVFSAL